MPSIPTTRSTPMRKFLDVCRRLEEHWAGDLIGLACLMALVPLVLFIGTLLHVGM